MTALLDDGEVLSHPFIIGELALGNLPGRARYLAIFDLLPRITSATDQEVLNLVEKHRLFRRGIGFIDAHLLAALALTADATLWTRDRRLADAANDLKLATRLPIGLSPPGT